LKSATDITHIAGEGKSCFSLLSPFPHFPSSAPFKRLTPLRVFMTDDWASKFRPAGTDEQTPQEMIEELFEEHSEVPEAEPVDQEQEAPTVVELFNLIVNRIDSVESRISRLENMVANPPYLGDLNGNLQAVLRDNAAAIVGANNQFMGILARKMDEMEERLSSDDPSFTNILYSSPELFDEVTQRAVDEENNLSTEEEFLSANKIAEMVEEEHPELVADMKAPSQMLSSSIDHLSELDPIRVAFTKWQNKEIKWHEFVKIAGGVKSASAYKKVYLNE